jgi:hypothetical protein
LPAAAESTSTATKGGILSETDDEVGGVSAEERRLCGRGVEEELFDDALRSRNEGGAIGEVRGLCEDEQEAQRALEEGVCVGIAPKYHSRCWGEVRRREQECTTSCNRRCKGTIEPTASKYGRLTLKYSGGVRVEELHVEEVNDDKDSRK